MKSIVDLIRAFFCNWFTEMIYPNLRSNTTTNSSDIWQKMLDRFAILFTPIIKIWVRSNLSAWNDWLRKYSHRIRVQLEAKIRAFHTDNCTTNLPSNIYFSLFTKWTKFEIEFRLNLRFSEKRWYFTRNYFDTKLFLSVINVISQAYSSQTRTKLEKYRAYLIA